MPDFTGTFANPELLWLLLLVPALAAWYFYRGERGIASMRFPSLALLKNTPKGWRVRFRHSPLVFRGIALALIVFALARPQTSSQGENVYTEGIDITLVLDVSGSMLAEDFRPNRVEAAKKVADNFIAGRKTDRIGLVIFAGESFTQCPLTTDYSVLRDILSKIKVGMLEDGTAIGEGLATGVDRMRNSKAKSKVIILLTDGVNNRGSIDPVTGAQIAQTFGIRVYTIGVGSRGMAPYPVQTPFGIQYQSMPVEIDEDMLKQIAELTGGRYFRATNNKKLEEIYTSIDKLEKSKLEVTVFRRYTELFYGFVLAAMLALLLEFLSRYFIFRKLP